jgi:hypothetical protein
LLRVFFLPFFGCALTVKYLGRFLSFLLVSAISLDFGGFWCAKPTSKIQKTGAQGLDQTSYFGIFGNLMPCLQFTTGKSRDTKVFHPDVGANHFLPMVSTRDPKAGLQSESLETHVIIGANVDALPTL